ncbi:MAG: nuclear transport factor 2 family protein [Bacteroidota bacterium]
MKSKLTCLMILMLTIGVSYPLFSQNEENIQLIEKQLAAYNERNIDEFVSCYSDSVKIYDFPEQLLYEGIETFRKNYAYMFDKYQDLNCVVTNRIVEGNIVIDHEDVLFQKGRPRGKFIAIYHIEKGKIQKVYFMTP